MARPKKTVEYNANSETIRRFYERSIRAKADQSDASTVISALNQEMEAAGVSSGCLSEIRKLAALPPGKRGEQVALRRFYYDIFEDVLDDPQVNIHDLIRQAKAREMESVASEQPKAKMHAVG